MYDDDLKALCRKLKPVMGRRADALWLAYATAETPIAKREAEALIQMCAASYLSPAVDDDSILLPPPTARDAAGEFPLGHVLYSGRALYPIGLTRQNFIRQICILAITGAGKTNVAQLLLLGLLEKEIPFLVVDWKRSYRDIYTVAHPKVNEVQVYTVGRKTGSPFPWNPLRPPPGVHCKTWIAVIAEALEKSHISGPGVADVLIEILDKKFQELGVYEGTPEKWPNFFDAGEELNKLHLKGRRMLWQDSCARILKTFTFGPAAGAFNARNPLQLEALLMRPAIIELDQELPKPLRVFFSDVL
jgi:Helicase HerA, central domain